MDEKMPQTKRTGFRLTFTVFKKRLIPSLKNAIISTLFERTKNRQEKWGGFSSQKTGRFLGNSLTNHNGCMLP